MSMRIALQQQVQQLVVLEHMIGLETVWDELKHKWHKKALQIKMENPRELIY